MADRSFWREASFWRRSGASAGGLWISVGLGFVTTVVVARSLGPRSFGAVALATGVVAAVTALLDLPLEEAAVHYGWRALVAGAPGSVDRLLRRALAADIAVGVCVAGLFLAGGRMAAELTSRGWLDPALVQLAAVTALFQTADGTTGAVLLLARRPELRAWSMAAASGCRLLFAGGAAVLLRSPRWVLAGAACGAALGTALQAALAWRSGWRRWRGGPCRQEVEVGIGTLLSFGVRSALATTISGGRNGLIPVLLGRLSGAEAVALFEVATFPLQAADVAAAPVRLALFPEQARLAAEKNQPELRRSVRAYVRGAIVVGLPGAVLGWFLLPWVIPTIYSHRYGEAVGPARILLIAAALSFALGWSKTLPAAVGRPGIRAAVLGLDAVLVIPLMVVLGAKAAEGAAIAVSAGLVAQALAWFALFRNVLNTPVRPPGKGRRPAPAATRSGDKLTRTPTNDRDVIG